MSKFGIAICGFLGMLALPLSAHADPISYWFSADPASQTVIDGTVSSTVSIYLNSNQSFYGVEYSTVYLDVQAGGNATLNSADYNHAYVGSASLIPPPGISDVNISLLGGGPTITPVTSVLLGTFDVMMPAGGTQTTVDLDEDPLFLAHPTSDPTTAPGAPVVIYTDATGDDEAVVVTFESAVFSPGTSTVPLPSAAWAGMGLLAILALTRKTRQLVLA